MHAASVCNNTVTPGCRFNLPSASIPLYFKFNTGTSKYKYHLTVTDQQQYRYSYTEHGKPESNTRGMDFPVQLNTSTVGYSTLWYYSYCNHMHACSASILVIKTIT